MHKECKIDVTLFIPKKNVVFEVNVSDITRIGFLDNFLKKACKIGDTSKYNYYYDTVCLNRSFSFGFYKVINKGVICVLCDHKNHEYGDTNEYLQLAKMKSSKKGYPLDLGYIYEINRLKDLHNLHFERKISRSYRKLINEAFELDKHDFSSNFKTVCPTEKPKEPCSKEIEVKW